MAILKGIISKLNGSAGNLTFKQLGGKTVVSEKISSTTNAKTLPQQKQRMKWANVVRMYKVLRDYMKLAFAAPPMDATTTRSSFPPTSPSLRCTSPSRKSTQALASLLRMPSPRVFSRASA